MTFRRFIAGAIGAALAAALIISAHAQTVIQACPFKPGNFPAYSSGGSSQPVVVDSGVSSLRPLAVTPLDYGCLGQGLADGDDTACLQSAVNAGETAGVETFFDGVHLYTATSLACAGICDLEGFAPVGNDGVSNGQVCLSGILSIGNTNLLVMSGPKVIVNRMCLQMAIPGQTATGGCAICLGGPDQEGDLITSNMIYRPYDGISPGYTPGILARDGVLRDNTIRSPGRYGIAVGMGTTNGQTGGWTLENNRIGCDTFDPNGIGFAFFDGALKWDGTTSGPNNCRINSEIIPGARQNVNGEFYGVMGDSAGSHGGANPMELYIEPQSSSGAIEWLAFTDAWAGSVVPNATQIYIGNKFNGICSNIKFSNVTVHSGVNGNGPAGTMVNIQGCQNIVFSGGALDAWENGTTTNGFVIAEGTANNQPVHVTISGVHIGFEGGTVTNAINIQTNGSADMPTYLSIVGTESSAATHSVITDLTPANSGGFMWVIANNEGIDDVCRNVSSATNIVLPDAATCIHATGTTTITGMSPAWGGRTVEMFIDSGLSLATGGTIPFCTAAASVAAGAMVILTYNRGAGCWSHQ